MNPPASRSTWPYWTACALWLLVFAAITTDVMRRPMKHTTMPTYRLASAQWAAGQDVYDTTREHDAFLYFPPAAVLFTPFAELPFSAGEILWRAATFGLFAFALFRLAGFFLPRDDSGKTFLYLSLLAIPASLASLRNAQFDLPLAAVIVLTAAEISRARHNAAAAWLSLAVALKPLAVVPLLLFGALERKLIPRLIVGLLLVVAITFLHWNPAFVAHEYTRCVETLAWASQANEARYSDLAALLSHIDFNPSNDLKTIVRIVFALVYLGLGFAATRRLNPAGISWAIGALSADYLMLFNPRTETCSYVFLSPFVASLALLYCRKSERRWLAFLLGCAALGLACDGVPKIGTFSVHDMTDRWLKPLIAFLFLPVLIEFIFRRQPNAAPDSVIPSLSRDQTRPE